MFNVRYQEQRISELKARIRDERQVAARQLRAIVPQTCRAAAIGSLVWGARRALPFVRPLALGLFRDVVGQFGSRRLVKTFGLAVLAFGAWRLLRGNGDDRV